MIRPFSLSAAVTCRGYSLPLQRAIVDFGADVSFGRIPEKLREHYGIVVPVSSARVITYRHGGEIYRAEEVATQMPERNGVGQLIVEMDGSMIPIVEREGRVEGDAASDQRKHKIVRWEEARLAMAHVAGSATPHFGATLGTVAEAGEQLLTCAIEVGAGSATKLHAVGDGAAWIAEQVEQQFGAQATYLIDFYHLCEYLAAAAEKVKVEDKQGWLTEQKSRIKENRLDEVVEELKEYMEAEEVAAAKAPVRALTRYVRNRPGQFNYKDAIAAGLPIGSGEIESAHRYVVQQRLKIPGAWWDINNARQVLALRVLRANGKWGNYWQNRQQKAA